MRERIAESKDFLVDSSDPDFDRMLKGMIRAFNEVLEFEPVTTLEEMENDEV